MEEQACSAGAACWIADKALNSVTSRGKALSFNDAMQKCARAPSSTSAAAAAQRAILADAHVSSELIGWPFLSIPQNRTIYPPLSPAELQLIDRASRHSAPPRGVLWNLWQHSLLPLTVSQKLSQKLITVNSNFQGNSCKVGGHSL
jgi:hypothetical protein